jgi:hypothetical protein
MKMNIHHCYTMSWWVERKVRIAKWKKTRDIKRQKIINKNIIADIQTWWIPNFSYHSLQRISDRLAPKVQDKTYIVINNQNLWYTRSVWWITPKLLRSVIADIRHSFISYVYSTESDTILTRWNLAKYIIWKWWEVITVITDEKIEKQYMKKHKFITVHSHSLKIFLTNQ